MRDFVLRIICWFKGHVPSPGPVAVGSINGQSIGAVYQCWRCYQTIPPPDNSGG